MTPQTTESLHYFDANALWKYYRDEKGDVNVRRLVARSSSQILISPLTLIEFLGVLTRYYRKRFIKRKHVNSIAGRMRRDSTAGKTNRPFRVIPVPAGSFHEAQSILLQYGSHYDLQSNDALHLAIVAKHGVTDPVVLVTSDRALQNTAQKKGVDCYDPEAHV